MSAKLVTSLALAGLAGAVALGLAVTDPGKATTRRFGGERRRRAPRAIGRS